MPDVTIRAAIQDDAEAVSALVIHTLRHTNAKDYPPATIAALVERFVPEKIRGYFDVRTTFVATIAGHVVGTAGLEGDRMRMVFTHPAYQGNGIGAALVRHIEDLARTRGLTSLWLESSRTAEAFYFKLGYHAAREVVHDGERMTVMERSLSA